MAIYHLHMQVIKRSQGKSSIAAAAYRHAQKIEDLKNDISHDFTKKSGVEYSAIMAPLGAPDWTNDREELWNKVEQKENRKDAQLCRELDCALPVELSKKDHINMIRRFAHESFVKEGMIADIAIHYPTPKEGKPENPHAHIMLTMRDIDKEGFGNKNRDWNDRKFIGKVREDWQNEVNQSLARRGITEEVTHERTNSGPSIHHGRNPNYKESRIKNEPVRDYMKEYDLQRRPIMPPPKKIDKFKIREDKLKLKVPDPVIEKAKNIPKVIQEKPSQVKAEMTKEDYMNKLRSDPQFYKSEREKVYGVINKEEARLKNNIHYRYQEESKKHTNLQEADNDKARKVSRYIREHKKELSKRFMMPNKRKELERELRGAVSYSDKLSDKLEASRQHMKQEEAKKFEDLRSAREKAIKSYPQLDGHRECLDTITKENRIKKQQELKQTRKNKGLGLGR